MKLIRPLGNYKVDNKRHLGEVLKDITDNGLRVMQYVADNPKRSDAKECKCFSAWYPCEYCYGKGTKIPLRDNVKAHAKIKQQINLIREQILECENDIDSPEKTNKKENLISLENDLKKSLNALTRKSNILWPSSTLNAKNRSRKTILEILEKMENGDNLTLDDCKGIKGRSLLLDLPHFNYIYDTPAEYMHCSCLGVTKRLVELTFDVGINRPRVTKRKLSSSAQFNTLMLSIKVTKEFPRRARKLDFAVYKGLEFRNMALFFWPLVLQCIEPNAKEISLWLNYVYFVRSCVIPSDEFSAVKLQDIRNCSETFYKLYEKLFGMQNCTYNLHTFCSHPLEIRTHGPLTQTSAFKFESFYGEIRRSFVPGTTSPLKQIMKKIYLKRNISTHYCKNSIFISNYDTPLESNKLIYCFRRKQHFIYEIVDIDGKIISCNKVGQYPVTFDETPTLKWSTVGVYKKGGVCSDITKINSSEIAGKVIQVGDYLITCPINVLNEK